MPSILYMQDHVFVYTKAEHEAVGVWIPGFLAVFSGGMRGEDVARLCWTSYEKVRQTQGVAAGGQRQKPLQTTDVPSVPHHLDQFTLKLPLGQCHSIWKHTPDLGRGVPIVRVCLQGGQELVRQRHRSVCVFLALFVSFPPHSHLSCSITPACASSFTLCVHWCR